MFGQRMPGTRLSYVVVKLEGTLMREVSTWEKPEGSQFGEIVRRTVPVPAGYLVYFPRGHVIRVPDEAHLRHYGLDKKPRIINMQGLADPESPLGKMMMAQDDATRAAGYKELEQQVMQMAIAKSGPVIMPEMIRKTRFIQAEDYTDKGRGKARETA